MKHKIVVLPILSGLITTVIATASIQLAYAGARFSEESGNLPPVRIGGLRVSYCTREGCNDNTIKQAANAFCQYHGYSYSTGWTRYRSRNRRRRDTIYYLGGNPQNIGNWKTQNAKRRWFTDIGCE